MLSVLIPVFNYDVRPLVMELHRQCKDLGISYEIICIDDCSAPGWQLQNRVLAGLENVQYAELEQNTGRSAIRNKLVETARFPYLIFLDCDSKIVRPGFIRDYHSHLSPGTVLYGGRTYSPNPPADRDLLLHWRFGVKREAFTAAFRTAAPYHRFMTNNFAAPKSILEKIPFEERIRQYGHEDTLFGFELKQRGIPILHLDNPVEHQGLETAVVFLEKTEKAVANLLLVREINPAVETTLLKWASLVSSFFPAGSGAGRLKNRIRNKLLTGAPSLLWLDLYKLVFLLSLKK